MLLMFWRCFRK